MPGFMIHLAEASMIMDYMKKTPDLEWCRDFFLGSILPDTRLGADKAQSHFWRLEHLDHLAQAPDLSRFLEKYGHRLNEPVILGYYAHLYLDYAYVTGYWPKIMLFEDKDGKPEARKKEIAWVELKGSHQVIPFKDFFSGEYYYGDYTRSNAWFIQRYHIHTPEYRELDDVGIDEIKGADLMNTLDEIQYLCNQKDLGDETAMKVFDLTDLENFVLKTAEAFYIHISHILNV